MVKIKNDTTQSSSRKIRPALTTEGRESQLISLAVSLAEKQLMEGTASSQVITHYLKLGTVKEQLEREKLAKENELLDAKTEAIQSTKNGEGFYQEVIDVLKSYRGD